MTTLSLFDAVPDKSDSPVYRSPQGERSGKKSRKSQDGDRMAAYFQARPNQMVSALTLEDGYGLRWRTTVSDLRYEPYCMDVRNHQTPYETVDGRKKRKSFYYFVPSEGK